MTADALKTIFDATWYLGAYPDVAQAQVDPWEHFQRFGYREGRLPCAFKALQLENDLWFNNETERLAELDALALGSDAQAPLERYLARWVLARWYAAEGDIARSYDLLHEWLSGLSELAEQKEHELALRVIGHLGPVRLYFKACLKLDSAQCDAVLATYATLMAQLGWDAAEGSGASTSDYALAEFMAGHDLSRLNQLYTPAQLTTFQTKTNPWLTLDDLPTCIDAAPRMPRAWWQRWLGLPGKVSVVIPCFNAGAEIETALLSLFAQSWPNMEVIVVDDASTDDSVQRVQQLVEQAPSGCHVKLLQQRVNQGAYAARNLGMQHATGAFLTTHDSDDWSHPEKIKCQVEALQANPNAQASMSHWVRCTTALEFGRWREDSNWVYPNVSSLMIRRAVLKQIGFWDSVSVNADSEYVERLRAVAGVNAIVEVLPGVPLSFGRHDAGSLSQHSLTHLRTQFFGVRRDYMQAARAWHAQHQRLYVPAQLDKRPFAAPPMICRGSDALRASNLRAWVVESGFFDAQYYFERYPDVAAACRGSAAKGLDHYLKFGAAENRDPSAYFSTTGYMYAHGLEKPAELPAIYLAALAGHLVACGRDANRVLVHRLKSSAHKSLSKPRLMVCAHNALGQPFGAELSLLDALQALREDWSIVLVLPNSERSHYVEQLLQLADDAVLVPYRWWHRERKPAQVTQQVFERLLRNYHIQKIYTNTLTLDEPLRAGKALGISVLVHVRELLPQDEGLSRVLGLEPDEAHQMVEFLAAHSDTLIANSATVGSWLQCADVVPNCIDCMRFEESRRASLPLLRAAPANSRLQVGMFSSNLPKKGLCDFLQLAVQLDDTADMHLFGPVTAELQDADLPRNVTIHGYVENLPEAMHALDVVVNLSHFAESFGRSVLESMAAGRVVAVYAFGALPELVGEAGILVPLGDTAQMAERLTQLAGDLDLARHLSEAAGERAWLFDRVEYKRKLRAVVNGSRAHC